MRLAFRDMDKRWLGSFRCEQQPALDTGMASHPMRSCSCAGTSMLLVFIALSVTW